MADNEKPEKIIDVETAPDVPETDVIENEYVEDHEDHREEHHEDSGVATNILKIAGLLVIGGALSLWLGPKIAPILPSGMAPVASWLAPGGAQTNSEITALQAELASMPEPVSSYEIQAMIAGAISTKTAALSTKIDALSGGPDNNELISRLAALELETDGLRAEVSALLTQLSDFSEVGGEVSADTATKLAGFAAVNEGLRAQIAALANRLDGVSATAAQVSVVETNAEVERNATSIRNSLNTIEVALSAGLPFASSLAELENAGIADIPAVLLDASSGVATMAKLRANFPEAAHDAIRASILASAGDGVLASIGAFAKAQVAGRSLTPQDGVGPDAVLSRAEAALKNDDLATALTEIDALPAASMPSEARGSMGDWVANATRLQNTLLAFDALQTSLTNE